MAGRAGVDDAGRVGTMGRSMNDGVVPPRATVMVTGPCALAGMRMKVPESAPATATRIWCPARKSAEVAMS